MTTLLLFAVTVVTTLFVGIPLLNLNEWKALVFSLALGLIVGLARPAWYYLNLWIDGDRYEDRAQHLRSTRRFRW